MRKLRCGGRRGERAFFLFRARCRGCVAAAVVLPCSDAVAAVVVAAVLAIVVVVTLRLSSVTLPRETAVDRGEGRTGASCGAAGEEANGLFFFFVLVVAIVSLLPSCFRARVLLPLLSLLQCSQPSSSSRSACPPSRCQEKPPSSLQEEHSLECFLPIASEIRNCLRTIWLQIPKGFGSRRSIALNASSQ